MADYVFNIAKGKVAQMAADADDLRMLFLTTAETEANAQDVDNVTAFLATAAVECTTATWTSYARETLTGEADIVDDTNNTGAADVTNVTLTAPESGETIVACLIYKHVTNDGDSIPLTYHDCSFTTNGSDVTIQIPATGFFVAS